MGASRLDAVVQCRLWDPCSWNQLVYGCQLGRERRDHLALERRDVGAELDECRVVQRLVGERETDPVEGRFGQAVSLDRVVNTVPGNPCQAAKKASNSSAVGHFRSRSTWVAKGRSRNARNCKR